MSDKFVGLAGLEFRVVDGVNPADDLVIEADGLVWRTSVADALDKLEAIWALCRVAAINEGGGP